MPFDGDVLWALGTVMAAGHAVNVKGPPGARMRRDIEVGAGIAARLRERDPAIAETFPARGGTPTP
jgi:hypothetical protein